MGVVLKGKLFLCVCGGTFKTILSCLRQRNVNKLNRQTNRRKADRKIQRHQKENEQH